MEKAIQTHFNSVIYIFKQNILVYVSLQLQYEGRQYWNVNG